MREKITGSALMLLAALIWGFAFVAQSVGMDYLGPMSFNGIRFLMGGAALLPVIFVRGKRKKYSSNRKEEASESDGKERRLLLLGGLLCGTALLFATSLQQFGLIYTTVGKSGFITALYIIFVPLAGLLLKKRVKPLVWGGAAIACAGFYLLCITENAGFNRGDGLTLACAFLFTVYILLVDYFSPRVDGVKLSCLQFWVCGILGTAAAFIWEEPGLEGVMAGIVPLVYTGVLSGGVAYTLQIIAQARLDPALVSLIGSLESVVSVAAGWLILKETMSARQLAGCVLVFAAVLLAQLGEFSAVASRRQAEGI